MRRLWLFVLICSLAIVFVGVWNFAMPIALSSALVDRIKNAPSDKVYEEAYAGVAGVMRFFVYMYVFLALVIGTTASAALFRSNPKEIEENRVPPVER